MSFHSNTWPRSSSAVNFSHIVHNQHTFSFHPPLARRIFLLKCQTSSLSEINSILGVNMWHSACKSEHAVTEVLLLPSTTPMKAYNWISGETATLSLHLSFALQRVSFLQQRTAQETMETLGNGTAFVQTSYTWLTNKHYCPYKKERNLDT